MTIQILGSGCPKCRVLEKHTRQALHLSGSDAVLEKVSEIDKILDMGVMMTPALVINGEVKSAGRILTKDQILAYIQEVS